MKNVWRRNFTSEKCKDCQRSLAQTRDGLCHNCLQKRLDGDYPDARKHPIRENADRKILPLPKPEKETE